MKKLLFVDIDISLSKVTQALLGIQDFEFISIDDHKRTYQKIESDAIQELQEYKPFQKKVEKVIRKRNNRDSRKSRNINHK